MRWCCSTLGCWARCGRSVIIDCVTFGRFYWIPLVHRNEMTGLGVLICSSVAIVTTSAVPLIIFFAFGPTVMQSTHRSLVLPVLLALAVGSLLGDVFYHLVPEILGLSDRSTVPCTWILLGIMTFFVGERVLQQYHQGHGHDHLPLSRGESALLGGPGEGDGAGGRPQESVELEMIASNNGSSCSAHTAPISQMTLPGLSTKKPMGLLILASDFIHNFVDGLAIGVSFAVSLNVGLSTSLAVFLHEIPHELADLAILLAAGYRPQTIVLFSMLATLSAFAGILVALGLALAQPQSSALGVGVGVLSTVVKPSVLSFTAGNFLYIALSDLVPELLHAPPPSGSPLGRWTPFMQYAAVVVGAASMLLIKLISN